MRVSVFPFVLAFASVSMLSGCVAPAEPTSKSNASSKTPARAAIRAETTERAAEATNRFVIWVWCANEYGYCEFTGTRTVAYGANGVFAYKTLTDGTRCNNETFGDPLRGVDKACYLL